MSDFKFYKNDTGWFVDLPEYIAQGGDAENLQMVEGADTMLEIIADGNTDLVLNIATEKSGNADQLQLLEKCHPLKGGGEYFLKTFEGKDVDVKMWLCGVVEFVFGDIPEHLFVRRIC